MRIGRIALSFLLVVSSLHLSHATAEPPPIDYSKYESQAFLDNLENQRFIKTVKPTDQVQYVKDGIIYQGTYSHSKCDAENHCKHILENIFALGPATKESSSHLFQIVQQKTIKSSNSNESNSSSGKALSSQEATGAGAATSSGAEAKAAQSEKADQGTILNWDSPAGKGLSAGLTAGAVAAFQDYIVITSESKQELASRQAEYAQASSDAWQSQHDLDVANQNLQSSVLTGFSQVRKNLTAIGSAEVALNDIIHLIHQSSTKELSSEKNQLNQQLKKLLQTNDIRPEYKRKIENTMGRFEKAPTPTSDVEEEFTTVVATGLRTSVESELLKDYEIADEAAKYTEVALDVLYGLDPYTGVQRNLYELVSRRNIITNEPLTDFELGLSAAGLALDGITLGISASAASGIKTAFRFIRKSGGTLKQAIAGSELGIKVLSGYRKTQIPLLKQGGKLTVWLKEKGTSLENLWSQINKALSSGVIKPMERLPQKLLEQPAHPKTLERIKEIASNTENINLNKIRVRPGTNKKLAIIGRGMERINELASAIKKEGLTVELFDADFMKNNYGIKNFINPEAIKEYAKEKSLKGHLTPTELMNTKIYSENTKWAERIKANGYTIIDVGNLPSLGPSPFYDIELETLPDLWRNL